MAPPDRPTLVPSAPAPRPAKGWVHGRLPPVPEDAIDPYALGACAPTRCGAEVVAVACPECDHLLQLTELLAWVKGGVYAVGICYYCPHDPEVSAGIYKRVLISLPFAAEVP